MFLGASRTEDVKELIYSRQSVVVHAKAYGLQAIDMVYINFKGMETSCNNEKGKMYLLQKHLWLCFANYLIYSKSCFLTSVVNLFLLFLLLTCFSCFCC